MSNQLIRASLEGRLQTLATSLGVSVAWENVAFEKPTTKFLEPFLIPVTTINTDVAGHRATYLGMFQVNCWAPTGNGMGDVSALAQSVIDAFPMLPKSGAVSIESTPSAAPPMEDEQGWVIVPVTIKYRYEASLS